MKFKIAYLFYLLLITNSYCQNVELYKQFGGTIDFIMIGNTLNQQENGLFSNCIINTESSTTLNLNASENIIAAYLYWAGSGEGDFEVKLNNTSITPSRTFSDTQDTNNRPFFSAFADVTQQVIATGNGTYTLSELDLTNVIPDYCGNATNFAGWAIIIVYSDENLPLNLINIYDGLQHVPTELSIVLDNLNVIDNIGAKIGFLAWEGDAGLSVNESLRINGNLIGNPPLNPSNNAFNGTNSFTGQSDLYNMDLDYYAIQNNINVGDTTATIQLTSGQDFVMINTIVTKLNSQLPDATVTINNFEISNCNEREITVNYTVHNTNSTAILPLNTSINIYGNTTPLESTSTTIDIPLNGFENFETILNIPEDLEDFTLLINIDEENSVIELNENNNLDALTIHFPNPPTIPSIDNIIECNNGFDSSNFDLNIPYSFLNDNIDNDLLVEFFESENFSNSLNPLFEYTNISNPQTIYVKATDTNTGCYSSSTFEISVYNCPPTIPSLFTPNGDDINENFTITGLKNVYTNYNIFIYNRWGNIVFEGDNNKPFWNGKLFNTKKEVPTGVYFYSLYLNYENYKPISGWVYLSR